MVLQEIEQEIANLSLYERAALAKHLIESLEDISDDCNQEEIEKEWVEVAEQRLDELENGRAEVIPVADAMKRIQDIFS
jgi:hypothetical protein